MRKNRLAAVNSLTRQAALKSAADMAKQAIRDYHAAATRHAYELRMRLVEMTASSAVLRHGR